MKSLLVVLLWGAAAEGGLQSFTQLATRMPSGREQHFECTSVAACPSESAAQCVKLGPSKCYSFAISPGWRGGKTSQLFAAGSLSATVHAGWTTWALGEAPPVKVEWLTPNIVMNKQGGQWSHVPPVKQGEGFGPVPPVDDKWRRNTSTVTVLIAALRETRCGKTLYSLFDKANHPSRVYIGVVQQNDPSDVDCLDDYCAIAARNGDSACKWRSHVRMKRLLAAQAAGPVYARALQRELVEPSDDFCVQIDAHTEGIDGWDNRFLNEWGATNNEFAVLSTYPTNIDDLHKNSNKHWEMPHLCCASLGGQIGAVRNCQAKAAANLEKPILAPLWAAGMSFARCHAERDVPNDINLRHIFTGEEFGRGVRLWTHGYDFYSVTRPIIGVYYGGAKGGKGGWRSVAAESQASYARLGTLLEWPGSDQSAAARRKLEGYGIGKRRTLKMYLDLNKVDWATKTIDPPCIVPWTDWVPGARAQFAAAHPHKLRYRSPAELRRTAKAAGHLAPPSLRAALARTTERRAISGSAFGAWAQLSPGRAVRGVGSGEVDGAQPDASLVLLVVAVALLGATTLCLVVCRRVTQTSAPGKRNS